MAAKLTKLTDKQKNLLYPFTVLAAVYKDEHQTAEEWLTEILNKLKNDNQLALAEVKQTTKDAVANMQQVTQERLEYFNQLADNLLAESTVELEDIVQEIIDLAEEKKLELGDIVQAVSDLAEEKKTSITTLAETEEQNITDLADQKSDEMISKLDEALTALKETKEGELTSIADERKAQLDQLADEKEGVITSTTDEFTTMADGYVTDTTKKHTDVNATLESLLENFRKATQEALSSEHLLAVVKSEQGIHGIRYWEDMLQAKDMDTGEWAEVGGGGLKVQESEPDKTNVLWIDSSSGGLLKYYDTATETWVPTKAVWG